jgi:hypothetical protein
VNQLLNFKPLTIGKSMKMTLITILISLLSTLACAKDTLTVYVYPPRVKLDWSSPHSLLNDLVGIGAGTLIDDHLYLEGKSDFQESYRVPVNYRSTMGHTVTKIQCTLPNGKLYEKWSSFSGQNYSELTTELIFTEKVGFSSMFYDFNDGYIISGDENYDKLITYNGDRLRGANGNLKKVNPRFLEVVLTPYDCFKLKEMVTFFEGFHYKKGTTLQELNERGPIGNLHFTTNIDPHDSYRKRLVDPSTVVGGGCAPYGIALLKEANYYDSELDNQLKLNIPVSEKLRGGLIHGKQKQVGISSIVFGELGASWEHEGYANKYFSQYDPQLLWNFIGQVRSCLGVREFEEDYCSEAAKSYLKRNEHLIVENSEPHVVSEKLDIKGSFGHNFQGQENSKYSNKEFEMNGLLLNRGVRRSFAQ